ncbi:hypothetical protein EYE40_11795 [Glaciihabitans arcticus]|uniref:Uncharacterized protein n=1 Tax=Glaciihabitans arcticus TaxID=2668039 RepID=A0A4V2JF47_9MICO|nr:hypothetical protein [Glaciihabitans arcticus]TBN58019.1 hypothetical protein EYE40_11795 [Glaciihabitans arcticus]
MNKTPIDELLRDSAPARLSADPAVRDRVSELVANTRTTKPKFRRGLLLIPAIGLGALALTAGAAITTIQSDITVPITYVSTSGDTVSCTASLDAGADDFWGDLAVSAYVRDHDWSDLGERIHARVLAEPEDARSAPAAVLLDSIPYSMFVSGAAVMYAPIDCPVVLR